MVKNKDAYSAEQLSRWVEPARVHRQIYTNPDIFELEMSRIFGTAWIYVGHESQIKKAGDYFMNGWTWPRQR